MQCGICDRTPGPRLPFICLSCIRDALYPSRVQLVQILLQQEQLGKEVKQEATAAALPSKNLSRSCESKAPGCRPTWSVQRATADQTISNVVTKEILVHIDLLRRDIENLKTDVAARRARLLQRRSQIATMKEKSLDRIPIAVESVEKAIRRSSQRFKIIQEKTLESRQLLCKEIAQLHGVRQHKQRKIAPARDVYSIFGMPAADLRELNNMSPTQITVTMTYVAQLLCLLSNYLSLKLPAEIVSPHRGHPLPMILSPTASYIQKEASVSASRAQVASHHSTLVPRLGGHHKSASCRPLHVDKNLPLLAKDDPVAYAAFVEGATFLAWDVAWLCTTQGMNVGGTTWEEVCAMGRNLWQLLMGPRSKSSNSREGRGPVPPPSMLLPRASGSKPLPSGQNDARVPVLGQYSHGTSYGFLAGHAGAEYMRTWRLASPVKVIGKVKAMLLAERTGSEWELLEDREWEGEGEGGGEEEEGKGEVHLGADPQDVDNAVAKHV